MGRRTGEHFTAAERLGLVDLLYNNSWSFATDIELRLNAYPYAGKVSKFAYTVIPELVRRKYLDTKEVARPGSTKTFASYAANDSGVEQLSRELSDLSLFTAALGRYKKNSPPERTTSEFVPQDLQLLAVSSLARHGGKATVADCARDISLHTGWDVNANSMHSTLNVLVKNGHIRAQEKLKDTNKKEGSPRTFSLPDNFDPRPWTQLLEATLSKARMVKRIHICDTIPLQEPTPKPSSSPEITDKARTPKKVETTRQGIRLGKGNYLSSLEQLALVSFLRSESGDEVPKSLSAVIRDINQNTFRTVHEGPMFKVFRNLTTDGYIKEHSLSEIRKAKGGKATQLYAMTQAGRIRIKMELEGLFRFMSQIGELSFSAGPKPDDIAARSGSKLERQNILEERERLLMLGVLATRDKGGTFAVSQAIEAQTSRFFSANNVQSGLAKLAKKELATQSTTMFHSGNTAVKRTYYNITQKGFDLLKENLQGLLNFATGAPDLESAVQNVAPTFRGRHSQIDRAMLDHLAATIQQQWGVRVPNGVKQPGHTRSHVIDGRSRPYRLPR